MEEIRAIVRGRVQGVGFRAKAKRLADLLGLCGWVRNLSDGSVEIFAQGSSENLDTFLLQLREYFQMHIENIDLKKQIPTTLYTDFQITRS